MLHKVHTPKDIEHSLEISPVEIVQAIISYIRLKGERHVIDTIPLNGPNIEFKQTPSRDIRAVAYWKVPLEGE